MDSTSSRLCANGCGFFGSPETRNLCSKCYGEFLRENIATSLEALSIDKSSSSSSDIASATPTIGPLSSSPAESKPSRCQLCNKRVGLTGFVCRCGGLYCGTHRLPEAHPCDFDYKDVGRATLAKELPLCEEDKLQYRI